MSYCIDFILNIREWAWAGVEHSIQLCNALLRVKLENGESFSPVEVLNDIEMQRQLVPNRVCSVTVMIVSEVSDLCWPWFLDYCSLCGVCVISAVFVFLFFWGDHGSRGWYDSPQPALRPVFIAAQCATLCVCVWSVCMHGRFRSYCCSNSACFVSVRALCYLFIVRSKFH